MSERPADLTSALHPDDEPLVREWRVWAESHVSPALMATNSADTLPSPPSCPIPLMQEQSRHTKAVVDVYGAQPADPLSVTSSVLLRWNATHALPPQDDENALLAHARWLVAREVGVAPDAGGWPIVVAGGLVLSATMQGLAMAVLARAYLLSGEERFLACARRALLTFTLDILDGGVCAPIGSGLDADVVFEAVSSYPAAHALDGFLIALLSLYDFATLTGDDQAHARAERGHASLHELLSAYDAGYRTRANLLDADFADQRLQKHLTRLLAALAACSECAHCQRTASQWATYSRRLAKRLRFHVAQARSSVRRRLWVFAGSLFRLPRLQLEVSRPYRVCVPITVYPVGGGMRAVMAGWRQAMVSDWAMEFLTAYIGPDTEGQIIYSFKPRTPLLQTTAISQSLFPNVFGYVLAGLVGLRRVLRQIPDYMVLLPQDGVYTAAFAAICAKLTGRRLVIVDHGNIRDIHDPTYAAERRHLLAHRPWLKRQIAELRLALYFPTVRALARFAARRSDHILAASDDIVEPYRRHLGVPMHRITRFPFMIDAERFAPPDESIRVRLRGTIGLPEDAIVIIMVNRLHPTKGVDVGVAAMGRAVTALPPDLRARVRVLIVGDGQLRDQVVADIRASGLEDVCRMWGEASADEVAMLLGISDIFLFSARRSINSMAVLEAMAAGCATVATVTSAHIAEYLEDGRGISAPVGDVNALASALATLIGDDTLRREMGENARNYVVAYHTGEVVRRHLLRATYWQPNFAATTLAVAPTIGSVQRQGEV